MMSMNDIHAGLSSQYPFAINAIEMKMNPEMVWGTWIQKEKLNPTERTKKK